MQQEANLFIAFQLCFLAIFALIFLQKFQSSFVENFRQNISIAVVWPKKQNYRKSLVDFWL